MSTQIGRELNEALEGRCWFSPLSRQNDPFDSSPVLIPAGRMEAKRAISAAKKANGQNWAVYGKDLRASVSDLTCSHVKSRKLYWNIMEDQLCGHHFVPLRDRCISCFTTDPLNTLMWSYYSSSFASFSFEFSLQDSLEFCSSVGNPLPITYQDERPSVSNVEYFNWLSWANAPASSKARGVLAFSHEKELSLVKRLNCFKSREWEHEKEWRFLASDPTPGYYSLGGYKLTAIVFGSRVNSALQNRITEKLPEHIARKIVKLSERDFSLGLAVL